MSTRSEALLDVLVHIQANLDGNLSLDALSQRAGLSAWHFHRAFKAETGETPASYVTRLRLERGAFRLQIQDASVLQIALDCGFNSHETFTRAFQRAFGKSPTAYRASRHHQRAREHHASSQPVTTPHPFALSATKVVRLREAHLAFVRHVGPYEDVPDTLFSELEKWAQRQQLAGQRIWMGIGHDAPSTTPAHRLRFDAALIVPAPFKPAGRIGCQTLPVGDFALTTHVGSYATLPAAYAAIFPRAVSLPGHAFVGLPAIEIYRSGKVDARLRFNETDICLPVTPREQNRERSGPLCSLERVPKHPHPLPARTLQ